LLHFSSLQAWECAACTLENDAVRAYCAACETPRPSDLSRESSSNGGTEEDHSVEPEAMEKLISLHLSDLDELRKVEPEITLWLKRNLHKCHSDKKIKKRIKELLGTFFYVGNFTFLGVWNELKAHCKEQALEMGKEMQDYFDEFNLGEVLGQGAPNAWGRLSPQPFISQKEGLSCTIFRVTPCAQEEASRRQADCAPFSFPRDPGWPACISTCFYIMCINSTIH
jgi:hypothetical protein